jgi:hypothetical protein
VSATATDVARIRDIAALLREQGVTPVFFSGWELRGNGLAFDPRGMVCHWDASTVRTAEWGSIATIIAGRSDVPPPLANFEGARCLDGVPKVGIVSAGRCNHAGVGGPYRLPNGVVIPADSANRYMLGCEWAWAGPGETLNAAAQHAYAALGYAVREVLG